ncbi:hypothetical protein KSF78_0009531 [Schistosoma japonicum]|nr:hypothetical protein KSF78_0009531 [Schistosoma japonicum]
MMLLLLVYINMSLMLIHESTQFKNSEADKMKLKRNTERIESALLSKLPVIQILERQITAEIGAMNNDLKKFNRSIDGYADCVRTNSISLRGINYAEGLQMFGYFVSFFLFKTHLHYETKFDSECHKQNI